MAEVNLNGLSRRGFVRLGGALVAASGLADVGVARAAASLSGTTVVFASWGGAYQDAEKTSYCKPFERATGARVIQDGPMDPVKFRTMVASGTPDWDVTDVTIDFLYAGAGQGLFEKIDTSIVDTKRIDPKFVTDYGVGCIVWSYNVGYNSSLYKPGQEPKTWADIFDLERFPGKRGLEDYPVATLEAALLADGVEPAQLYPLDIERALKKLDTIRAQTIFWETNSQSQQLFVDNEINLGMILNGRVYDAAAKGAPLALSWEQNIQSVDYLVVPHGSKVRDAAMMLIDTMTVAENQAKLANIIAYSPTNPDAFKDIDPKIAPWLCTQPDNQKKGFVINADYWRDNMDKVMQRWTSWKLG